MSRKQPPHPKNATSEERGEERELALKVFQDRLGYHFTGTEHLDRALTHSSTGIDNYERLEFLGDRVLGLVVAEILFRCFPFEKEGALARRQAAGWVAASSCLMGSVILNRVPTPSSLCTSMRPLCFCTIP